MLGASLVAAYEVRHEVLPLSRHTPSSSKGSWIEADLGVPGEFRRIARERRPDVVVHTAALTNVDDCERNPELATRVNRDAVAEIAEYCVDSGAGLVHISTDAVFDGTKTGRYTEFDEAAPPHVYGRTKLQSERLALTAPGALVLRTNIFGWRRGRADSLAEWILHGLRANSRLTMFTDVLFTPIAAQLLAPTIVHCSELGLGGLYHAGGSEAISKHEFALRIADAYGLPSASIEAISVDDRPAPARRAKNMSLDSTRLEQALGRSLPGVDESVAAWRAAEPAEEPA
jgi:dTDP-4-dehydrorhamnose reductase